jgi:CheY-like chemotaxis protein
VEYRIDVSKKLCQGDVDRQQFQRMLHNLVRNSEQAIHREGIISIRLCPAQDFADLPPSSLPTDANPAEWVILQVSDNGEGIAEEILGQIFEPYFTTRADASGLGLTVCESIIKAHGATLTLESQRGEGTTATIAVPVYHGAAEHLPVSRTDPAKPAIERPASRRVLILEDEPLIRRLITSNLTNAGCEVEQTADGADTVEVYRKSLESGTPFDLLIMDLSIPGGVGGLQAMEQLRQLDPDVMAIVSSGYSDDPVMQRYLDYGFRARLPKPYQPSELRELVNGLLSER